MMEQDERPTWMNHLLWEHSGLLLTFAYLLLIFIGLMYEMWLFRRFRVNILYYADAADFLLVPFREPLVTLVSVAPLPLWFLYMRGMRKVVMSIPRLREVQLRRENERSRRVQRVASVVAVVLWSITFSAYYAQWVGGRIRSDETHMVRVEPSGGGAITGPMIGTTANFVFVYDRAAQKTHIVPVENIARITVDSPPRKSDVDQTTPAARSSATSSAP